MRVAVVGAGVGGLTLALALARRGMQSVVLERAEALSEVGAGLQLSPNACRSLFALGVEGEIRAIGFAPDRVQVRDAADGGLLLEYRLGAFAEARWGAPYLQVRRADLQGVLIEAVQKSSAIDLRLGAEVASIETAVGAITLSSGEGVEAAAVVGCDGLNSTVRAAHWSWAPARFTGQTAWRGLARASDLDRALGTSATVWAGPGRHLVHYPVGQGLVNMVAVIEAGRFRDESWVALGDRNELAAAFASWPEPARAIIAAVEAPWRSALYDRPPLQRWSKGRATLLGDAAHPMLPFLAQGAAMAIEDAAALAESLDGASDIPAALLSYEKRRLLRNSKVQAWSRRNAALFHLPSPALKAVFGAASTLDKLSRQPSEARFDWLYSG